MNDDRIEYRMLYLVGGAQNAERVDVADLFGKQLAERGLRVDYVIFDGKQSKSWQEITWHGARAFVVGSSQNEGLIGAVINKLFEIAADLRTFWLAMTGPYDIIQIRDKFVVGVLGLSPLWRFRWVSLNKS